MLIGSESATLELSAFIKEPMVNREASDYIVNHYNDLINIIRRLEIKEEKAQDLIHDVYISIVESEDNGNGFDMEFGSTVNEKGEIDVNIMDVSQFVIGRIKLYAKNSKYRTDIVEGANSYITTSQVFYETELDAHGQEVIGKDGKPRQVKKIEKHKVAVMMTSNAASFDDGKDADDINDKFQKAFAIASVADSTEDVAEVLSIREQIDYCIDICNLHNVNLLNILKNMDMLAEMLGDYSKKKKTAEAVFSKITDLVEYHTELADNLMEVFRFSAKNRAAFDSIIATY